MPILRMLDGTEIVCENAKVVREVVGELADKIAPVGVALDRAKPAKKKRTAAEGGPGKGPAKLWAMAQWYSVKIGEIKNDARSKLTKLRKADQRAYLDLQEDYHGFIKWYAHKGKIDSPEQASEALSLLFDNDHAQYVALLGEYEKQKPAKKKPAVKKKTSGRR